MEYKTKMRKYIMIDADIATFIDFNGWPDEVVIWEVEGLKKALDVTCLFFDSENTLSFSDMRKIINDRKLRYKSNGLIMR